jgi:hypothetical protein
MDDPEDKSQLIGSREGATFLSLGATLSPLLLFVSHYVDVSVRKLTNQLIYCATQIDLISVDIF